MGRALLLLLLLGTAPALAQGGPGRPQAQERVAPYDTELMRLAEVLGSIHYLRNLCKSGEGARWRDTMQSLLVAENPGPTRKKRLIARFNRGYRAFDGTYGSCTESAVTAAQRYMDEGVALASKITGRYGR